MEVINMREKQTRDSEFGKTFFLVVKTPNQLRIINPSYSEILKEAGIIQL